MTTKRCDCGNDDVLPGYRVCAECKEAREIYPRIFEGDEPDKLPDDSETVIEVLRDANRRNLQRLADVRAERDALKAHIAAAIAYMRNPLSPMVNAGEMSYDERVMGMLSQLEAALKAEDTNGA